MNTRKLNRRLAGAAVTAAVLLGASPAAFPGNGSVTAGKVDVSVYFGYDETKANLDPAGPWNKVFNEFSKLLWNSTEGQLQLGTVTVYNNAREALDGSDFIVMPADEGARANVSGFGQLNKHVWISTRHKSTTGGTLGQFGAIHEWGHYHFGLWDEYIGEKRTNNAAQTTLASGVQHALIKCVEDAASAKACIMDGGSAIDPNNQRTEFCTNPDVDWPSTKHYHGGAQGGFLWWNKQGAMTGGKSCWESLSANVGITYPAAEPSSALPAGYADPVWDVVDVKKRVVVCIDRSGSMDSDGKLGSALSAASTFTYFVDIRRTKETGDGPVTIAGDDLGVTAFDDGSYVYYALGEMVDAGTKGAVRSAIGGISSGGSTSIGGGLRVSLNEILRFPKRVSGEAIILLSDGQHNAGEHPDTVIPDLNARKVKVYTIAVGSDADASLLQSISSGTGGQFYYSAGPWSLARIFLELQARTRGGQLVFEAGSQTIAPEDTHVREILVDEFTDEFTVVFSSAESQLAFALLRPDGSAVDPANPGAGVERFDLPLGDSYRVSAPALGTWKARVVAPPTNDQGTFTASVPTALPIADYSTVTSTLDVAGAFTVGGIEATVDIAHTFTGDLTVKLRSPAGKEIVLHNRTGGGTDNIVGTYGTTLTPAEPFAGLAGDAAAGTWTLTVTDSGGGDSGQLNGWGLHFFTGMASSAEYQLQAFSAGGNVAVTATVDEDDVTYPAAAEVHTTVVAGDAVAGAVVVADVETPDGAHVEMPFFDDGEAAHGDDLAGDGTYSARFSSFTTNGTYRMLIRVTNTSGTSAPALEEVREQDPGAAPRTVRPFTRTATQEFRANGVPSVRRRLLRVDAAKLVQGRGTKDSLALSGRLNAAAGDIDPARDDVTVTFGSYTTTFPKGTLVRKGTRGKWTFRDATRTFTLDLFRGGSGLSTFALAVKGTDLDAAADVTTTQTVRLQAGAGFDETMLIQMTANPDPETGGGYRIGPNNTFPNQFFLDVLSISRNAKKPQKDKFVAALRFPAASFDPASQDATLRLGGNDLNLPAGTLVKGKKNTWAAKVPFLGGTVAVSLNADLKLVKFTGSKLDLAALPTPLDVDLVLGATVYRQQFVLAAKGATLVY